MPYILWLRSTKHYVRTLSIICVRTLPSAQFAVKRSTSTYVRLPLLLPYACNKAHFFESYSSSERNRSGSISILSYSSTVLILIIIIIIILLYYYYCCIEMMKSNVRITRASKKQPWCLVGISRILRRWMAIFSTMGFLSITSCVWTSHCSFPTAVVTAFIPTTPVSVGPPSPQDRTVVRHPNPLQKRKKLGVTR
jgi:hypothetical protein